MTLKSSAKFEEKLTCGLKNDMMNLAKFHQSTRKSQDFDPGSFIQSRYMSLKFIEELYAMKMKNDAKFGQ